MYKWLQLHCCILRSIEVTILQFHIFRMLKTNITWIWEIFVVLYIWYMIDKPAYCVSFLPMFFSVSIGWWCILHIHYLVQLENKIHVGFFLNSFVDNTRKSDLNFFVNQRIYCKRPFACFYFWYLPMYPCNTFGLYKCVSR